MTRPTDDEPVYDRLSPPPARRARSALGLVVLLVVLGLVAGVVTLVVVLFAVLNFNNAVR